MKTKAQQFASVLRKVREQHIKEGVTGFSYLCPKIEQVDCDPALKIEVKRWIMKQLNWHPSLDAWLYDRGYGGVLPQRMCDTRLAWLNHMIEVLES